MSVMNFAPKTHRQAEPMPTMSDVFKLVEATNKRIDAMDAKLDDVHAYLRETIQELLGSKV